MYLIYLRANQNIYKESGLVIFIAKFSESSGRKIYEAWNYVTHFICLAKQTEIRIPHKNQRKKAD